MLGNDVYVHQSSVVDPGATIGDGTKIWHFSHIFAGAVIGKNCTFGQNTMVSDAVTIGDNVKVQNNVAIYSGTTIESDVFLGPSCVLTNVSNPRSEVVRRGIYECTRIRRGTTIGANATIVCGVTLGRYVFVAAGTVVTRDFPDYALVIGVPGIQVGWMSRHGHKLQFNDDQLAACPESNFRYKIDTASTPTVRCLDLAEETPLPANLRVGRQAYRSFDGNS